MQHVWLLTHIRQLGRPSHSAATSQGLPSMTFFKGWLRPDNFRMVRTVAAVHIIVPKRGHRFDYEFQFRKGTLRLTADDGYSMQAALWATYENDHHRMTHWISRFTVFNIDNPRSSISDDKSETAKLRKNLEAVGRTIQKSNKGQGKYGRPNEPQQLALLPPAKQLQDQGQNPRQRQERQRQRQ